MPNSKWNQNANKSKLTIKRKQQQALTLPTEIQAGEDINGLKSCYCEELT